VGTASAIVVGSMIGAGVFTTSGFALADLGSARWVLLAWLLGGAIALCGALSYGGIARRIPESGGEYTFLTETFHPAAGFLAGWVSLLAGFTGPIAAAALAFEAYIGDGVRGFVPEGLLGSGLIVLAGLLHGLRLGPGARTLNAAVLLKLAALVAFALWGGARIAANGLPAAEPVPLDVGALGVTLVWVSFSYSGWNGAVYLAGEIRDPERNLARALWLPALCVMLVYLALNAVFLGAAPTDELVGRPDVGAAAAAALGGPGARTALSAVVGLALFTSISAMVAAGPRVYARMARDGYLPHMFAQGEDVPTAAVALQVVLAVAVVWLADLATLLGTLGFTLSLSAALTVVAACILRLREGANAVPIPLFPLPPLLFVASSLWAAWFLVAREPAQAGVGLLIALAGLPVYALARRRR